MDMLTTGQLASVPRQKAAHCLAVHVCEDNALTGAI